jgi:hypothetical protein
MMTLGVEAKLLRPAFLLGVLALFLSVSLFPSAVQAQKGVKDMPPPPPPWKAKPTPTPKPVEPEVPDIVRISSNLVMVPVSVTDPQGNAVQGLTLTDFRLIEEGKQQEITQLGDPEQVPLAVRHLEQYQSKRIFRFAAKSRGDVSPPRDETGRQSRDLHNY